MSTTPPLKFFYRIQIGYLDEDRTKDLQLALGKIVKNLGNVNPACWDWVEGNNDPIEWAGSALMEISNIIGNLEDENLVLKFTCVEAFDIESIRNLQYSNYFSIICVRSNTNQVCDIRDAISLYDVSAFEAKTTFGECLRLEKEIDNLVEEANRLSYEADCALKEIQKKKERIFELKNYKRNAKQ